ncbi:MAG: 2-amino-4-hydroxy-6-hydroxymethyldihydropteridine diphosphokinase [Calditrichia bacterium]
MNLALLALGSNRSPRETFLEHAVDEIQNLGSVTAIASLYESEPYGEAAQPQFLNTALALETELQPRRLLSELKAIEKRVGRRKSYRWGPREIDIDIIFFDDLMITSRMLTIPHVDYHNRAFVLKPLTEMCPDFVCIDTQRTIANMYADCPNRTSLNLYKAHWMEKKDNAAE